jgi:peptide chain release factor subunit 1
VGGAAHVRKPIRALMAGAATELLDRLSALPSSIESVVSVYLDLDPEHFPHVHDRRAELDSLLEAAERRKLDSGRLSRAERLALRSDIEQLREHFSGREELAPPAARGLAIFYSGTAGIFEVMKLPRAASPAAVVARKPFIEPLVELTAPERWAALLVSRRFSRIFRGTRERLAELEELVDDVHRQHAQGGWSQARYQRGIEHEVDEHIGATCKLLYGRFQREPFERLLIGGPRELHMRVERALHEDLRRRLAGYFEIDVERASADEVLRRALPAIETSEREREDRALVQLREGMAPGDHAATGLDEVLALLDERRVRTLLVAEDFAAPGLVCPDCGWLAAIGEPAVCRVDGGELESREDIVGSAIEAALAQDAEVLVFRHRREELADYGSIAALLHY